MATTGLVVLVSTSVIASSADILGVTDPALNTFGVEGSHKEPKEGQIWPRLEPVVSNP